MLPTMMTPDPEGTPAAILSWDDYIRARACVNACAGIPTDDLEQCPSGGLFHLADMANEVVKQRDELLAALEFACKKIADLHLEAGDGDCHYPIINDAIASVKGGAA